MTDCEHSWYMNASEGYSHCPICGIKDYKFPNGKTAKEQQLTTLQAYHLACEELLSDFIKTYFCDDDIRFDDVHHFWVGGNIGEIVFINDYYFDMTNIADAIDLMVEKDSLFQWYEQWTEPKNKKRINLKSWVLFTQGLSPTWEPPSC